jgi:hypothetical protein
MTLLHLGCENQLNSCWEKRYCRGAKVTKVTWTEGQGGSRLSLGGKAVLGEGCRASCDSSRDACFFGLKNEESGRPYQPYQRNAPPFSSHN